MGKTTLVTLVLVACFAVSVNAEEKEYRKLPKTAIELIKELKETKEAYAMWEIKLDYVKEKDLPRLVELLDSNEPCAYSVMSLSSHLPSGRSTVGNEAACLIESFWKRYYPTKLTSNDRGTPSKSELKRWYAIWATLKKMRNKSMRLTKNSCAIFQVIQYVILNTYHGGLIAEECNGPRKSGAALR